MVKKDKKIILDVEEVNFISVLIRCAYAVRRKPDKAEILLEYMIKESLGKSYYAGSGKRQKVMRELNFTRAELDGAMNRLVQTGTIKRKNNDKNNNLCYFTFSPLVNKYLK